MSGLLDKSTLSSLSLRTMKLRVSVWNESCALAFHLLSIFSCKRPAATIIYGKSAQCIEANNSTLRLAIRLPIHSPYVASGAAESERVTGCNIGAILLEYIRASSIWWRSPPKRRSAIPQTVSIIHYEKGRREDSRDTALLIPKGSLRWRCDP